ncbi:MAG: DUF4919 domain-containing protein [Candidatus Omnitrophica bacterium]|nr:DUF4919 domain-containing protein [Candidatus Omnitrophota bacterium]
MLRRPTYTLLLLFFAVSAFAAGKNDYDALLAGLKKGDRNIDFSALRIAYTRTPSYKPYDEPMEVIKPMLDAMRAKDYAKAIQYADTLLKANYVDIGVHRVLRNAYTHLNNKEKADFHKFVFDGLIKSIQDSGDGLSAKTAYKVINVAEEYDLLGFLGFKMENQRLVNEGGHFFDRMEVKNIKTGQNAVLYFNVDLPYNWMVNQTKASTPPAKASK